MMMRDVLIALIPCVLMAVYVFRSHAVFQIAVCVASCLASEAIFSLMRGKKIPLRDGSAAVTGVILALSLPWSAPWYVGVIGSFVAIGIGKIIYGGLGQNVFNPAMVGRAFVMINFPVALGASAYVSSGTGIHIITQATPLTAAKLTAQVSGLWPLFLGTCNGSLGEVSALACLIGGLYLCFRRTASWEIPAGIFLSVIILGGVANMVSIHKQITVLHHLFSGALFFGAFFIATDPVTSPLTPLGKWIFGIGLGFFIMMIRLFSGYPEGVMFAVLLMNGCVPIINRYTIPVPVGGPVPEKKVS